MNSFRAIISSAIAIALLFLVSACQLVEYAALQVGEFLHDMHTYSIAGTVTDSSSKPLTTATLAVDNGKPRPLNGARFSGRSCGGTVDFTFAAPGYYSRTFSFTHDGLFEVMPDSPSFPVTLLTPVSDDPQKLRALDKIENPASLLTFRASLRTSVGPKEGNKIIYFDIDRPDLHQNLAPSEATTTTYPSGSFPRNAIYVRVQLDPSNANFFASSGPLKESEVALPTFIDLVSTSSEGGLKRIPFEGDRFANGRPRIAPETGYSKEITLSDSELRQLENSHYIPFYFKAGKIYGRGVITDCYTGAYKSKNFLVDYFNLDLTLHIQPDGTRNVE